MTRISGARIAFHSSSAMTEMARNSITSRSALSRSTGLALQAAGLAVRIWSMRTLRASYSRTLRAEAEQPVVDRGPYRLVRHPGYLGSLMTWTGFALTSRSTPVVATVAALLARVYSHRITAEEALLHRELPGYLEYTGHTNKLIPFVW